MRIKTWYWNFKKFKVHGAALGWQLNYSPLGISLKTKGWTNNKTVFNSVSETLLFNFLPAYSTFEDSDEEYPFKPVDRSRIEQIFQQKNQTKHKPAEKQSRKTRK